MVSALPLSMSWVLYVAYSTELYFISFKKTQKYGNYRCFKGNFVRPKKFNSEFLMHFQFLILDITKKISWFYVANNLFSLFSCFQQAEKFTQVGWKWWVDTVMTNHFICMQSTCTTWTGWSTRSWRYLLVYWAPLALESLFLYMQSSSSKRRLHPVNFILW